MTLPLFKLTIPIFLISIFSVFGAHIAAYDTGYINVLAADLGGYEGCESACFMGIQARRMTGDDVLQILENHAWVADNIYIGEGFFVWHWSGDQPEIIDGTVPGVVQMHRRGFVQYIVIETHATLHELQSAFGQPNAGVLSWGFDAFSYRIIYFDRGMKIMASASCPVEAFEIPTSRTTIIWERPLRADLARTYTPPRWNIPLCAPK